MSDLKQELLQLKSSAEEEINSANSGKDLEDIKNKYLSRKGALASIFNEFKNLSAEERPQIGELANSIKNFLTQALENKLSTFKDIPKKEGEFDYTLPGRAGWLGKYHPIMQVLDRMIEILYGMGFEVVKGPEVETDYYNFEALNFPPEHPARDMQDTLYVGEKILLRTHTSPVQVRTFEKRKPPVKIIAPGKVYRAEEISARSYGLFHQVEGFYVDKDVTFADLKGVLHAFVWEFFGKDMPLRFRPSFFPFTEPSAEVDIRCIICGGKGCSVCKQQGWLEILGAGMIDPAVFNYVGYDPEVYSGYAFGMGVERIAMLKYQINDIRLFFENDLKFLRQF
jgi:phenylalanyl-tRNA synthetase alpha chain